MRGDIVVYGAEDRQGRALFAISALHHCGGWLAERGIRVRFVAAGRFVEVAAEVLGGQTGLAVSTASITPREHPDEVFADAGLFVGVVFSSPRELALDEAAKRQVRAIAAVQFPSVSHLSPAILENMRCAIDPLALAGRVRGEVLRLQQGEPAG